MNERKRKRLRKLRAARAARIASGLPAPDPFALRETRPPLPPAPARQFDRDISDIIKRFEFSDVFAFLRDE